MRSNKPYNIPTDIPSNKPNLRDGNIITEIRFVPMFVHGYVGRCVGEKKA